MTEQTDDETLAWTREIVADLADPRTKDDQVLRDLGTTDAETDVLAAMAQMPEDWQRHLADMAQRIVTELADQSEALPSAGRHARAELPGA